VQVKICGKKVMSSMVRACDNLAGTTRMKWAEESAIVQAHELCPMHQAHKMSLKHVQAEEHHFGNSRTQYRCSLSHLWKMGAGQGVRGDL